MTLAGFIPTVWSGTMLRYLDKALVFAQEGVVNRDYEGEITGMGDSVKINQIGPVTISNYTRNTNMSAPETLTDAQQTLVIDQAKSFHFQVDDIDKAQQTPKVMQTAMSRAAYGVRDVVDQALAALISAAVPTANILTADTSMAAIDAYDHLVELGVVLDENNVPSEGRWAIIPPWYHGLLLKDARFVGYGTAPQDDRLRNGQVGTAAGFSILKSNNTNQPSAGSTYDVTVGTDASTSFAQQIVEVEAYRPELRFGDAVKGLTVYGYKVILPAGLAKIVCTKP